MTMGDMDSSTFYSELKRFSDPITSIYGYWDSKIIYNDDDNPTMVKATRFTLLVTQTDVVNRQWPIREELMSLYHSFEMDGEFSFCMFLFPLLLLL